MTHSEMRGRWHLMTCDHIKSDIDCTFAYIEDGVWSDARELDIADIKQDLLDNELATDEELG